MFAPQGEQKNRSVRKRKRFNELKNNTFFVMEKQNSSELIYYFPNILFLFNVSKCHYKMHKCEK